MMTKNLLHTYVSILIREVVTASYVLGYYPKCLRIHEIGSRQV